MKWNIHSDKLICVSQNYEINITISNIMQPSIQDNDIKDEQRGYGLSKMRTKIVYSHSQTENWKKISLLSF